MLRAGELDLHPTYFETVTAMAFVSFGQARLDRVVLETGLGGRLDATNVVAPELCVITPIDLDHQVFLGDTIEQIAAEKAGILKPGVPAFSRASTRRRPRCFASMPGGRSPSRTSGRSRPGDRCARQPVSGPRRPGSLCPLAGEHQVENARTAALALRELGFAPDGIAHTRVARAVGTISRLPDMILDGAHNPAGVRALASYIRHFYTGAG